ncbi:MAG: LysR family transcriptional regulator [Gammaproteobacteria bacterium]|nr:LysR family transcriptional regulator [Gammaproteobacteria bacterium]
MANTYYKQNHLKKLRAFCQTAKLGSMTKASKSLFVSQPTISLQIHALEEEMDTLLFERCGPRLKLTTEGSILYDLCLPHVQGIDRLKETFDAHCGNLTSGDLSIAAGESTILYILPKPVRLFSEQYPAIKLRLANETGRDGMELLRSDKVDFAVGSMLEVPDDLIYDPIVTYNPVVITPLDHPLAKLGKLTLKDIGQYGLILPPRHLSTWHIVKMVFAQHNVNFQVTLEAGGWEVIKRYVSLGQGISIVTDVCITDDDRSKMHVIPVSQYFPKRSYGTVTRSGKFLSAPSQRFIEIMNACFDKNSDVL